MKTLLLSLIGIVGSTSSSIIPVVMSNQHSVNQIKTSKSMETKEFSYFLDTNYSHKSTGIYNHDKELSDFFSSLKNFIESHKIKSWKVIKASSKFGKLEKKDFNADFIHDFNRDFNNLDDTLTIAQRGHLLYSDSNHWVWYLTASFDLKSGGGVFFEHFDAYGDEKHNLVLTNDQLESGFTNTFTIEYEAEDKIDISAGNLKDSPTSEMKFYDKFINDFKNDITLNSASNILKDSGYTVKPEWLTFKEAIWLETNQEVTDDLIYGRLGAGQYHIKVTVEASTTGIENNIIGEMTFFMTLKYEYGDLNIYNNQYLKHPITVLTYEKFMNEASLEILGEINGTTGENALILFKMKITDYYDSVTGKKLTEEDFNKIPPGSTTTLYTFLYPGENEKKLGILNSAKLFVKLIKRWS